jgi:purine-cytosine permease-like protein
VLCASLHHQSTIWLGLACNKSVTSAPASYGVHSAGYSELLYKRTSAINIVICWSAGVFLPN